MRKPESALVCLAGLMLASVGAERPSLAARGEQAKKPIRALLVLGGCCHEYDKQKDVLTQGISQRANVTWTVAYDPDKGTTHLNPIYERTDWAKDFDVIVHDECTSDMKEKESIERILAPHRAGLPGVVLHCGEHSYRSEGWPAATPWFDFTGGASTGHGPQVPIAITFLDNESPITKGMSDWTTINEEMYNNSAGKLLDTAKPLARGKQIVRGRNGDEPTEAMVVWTNTYGAGTRVFTTTLGHNTATVTDPRYLDLVARGLLWSVGKLGKDGKPVAGYGPRP